MGCGGVLSVFECISLCASVCVRMCSGLQEALPLAADVLLLGVHVDVQRTGRPFAVPGDLVGDEGVQVGSSVRVRYGERMCQYTILKRKLQNICR